MAMMIEGHEFYTTDEACAALGVKAATLYAYVSRGLLRSYREGIKRRRMYRRSEQMGIGWPTLKPSDVGDILSYLNAPLEPSLAKR